jgi:hypothetical protein
MPRVFNRRGSEMIPQDAVYVGRPTKWGKIAIVKTRKPERPQ